MLDTSAAKAQATLLDAWQRSLPLIDEALQGDRLVDVVDIKASKTVVVTARHVALLRVRVERQPHTNYHQLTQRRAEANGNMAYRKQWMVPIARVQSVNGDPDYLKCTLNVVDRLKLGPAQVQVPRRRLLQCSSQILYEQLLSAIKRVDAGILLWMCAMQHMHSSRRTWSKTAGCQMERQRSPSRTLIFQ